MPPPDHPHFPSPLPRVTVLPHPKEGQVSVYHRDRNECNQAALGNVLIPAAHAESSCGTHSSLLQILNHYQQPWDSRTRTCTRCACGMEVEIRRSESQECNVLDGTRDGTGTLSCPGCAWCGPRADVPKQRRCGGARACARYLGRHIVNANDPRHVRPLICLFFERFALRSFSILLG